MKSLFSTPTPCAALNVEQPLLETAITQKKLATFIVVVNRAIYASVSHQTTPLM